MNSMLKSAVVLGALAAAIAAHASPIRYTVTATGSGTLDGTSFTNALITVTAVADTANVSLYTSPTPTIYQNTPTSTSVTVAGLGTDTLTGSILVTDNQTQSAAGFYDQTAPGNILFADNPALATYDLRSYIGPVGDGTSNAGTGSGFNTSFGTSKGRFVITSATNALFSAGPVNPTPEPSALAALGVGLVALARRRKRA